MRSFFTEPENVKEDVIILTEDASHIKKVLRMQPGDEVLVFDGTGAEYLSEIEEIELNLVKCRIKDKKISESEPQVKVTVFQGIPKADKMEQIIQKCVELGVFCIVPVKTDRCIAKVKDNEKIKRWNKISREAVKQCGRGVVPKVMEPVSFKDALNLMKEMDVSLMPYEVLGHDGEHGLKEILKDNKNAREIGIIIGPEGGFSDSEAKLAGESGIKTIGLGKRILRTETVASSVLSVIMYEYDEF